MSARDGAGKDAVPAPFGERHALRACVMLAALAVALAATAFGAAPSRLLVLAVAFVLACSPWFRQRHMFDERRRDEAMEDERDRDILRRADAPARAVLAAGVLALAALLCVPVARQALLAGPLALPGALLMLAIASALAGHVAVLLAYRKARG